MISGEGFVGNFQTTVGLSDASDQSDVLLKHGVVVVATGAQYRTPTEYSYGRSDRILSQKELEEVLSGNRQSPIANRQLQSVAMIQCVGSREADRPYCSRICCTEAVKNALAIKELNPDADVFVLYRD